MKKAAMIRMMMMETGKAAMMDTVWRFAIELSLPTSAIGSRISRTDQKTLRPRSKPATEKPS